MSTDLKFNVVYHPGAGFDNDPFEDLVVENGDIATVSDGEEIEQTVRFRLRRIAGEWVFDYTLGIDWVGDMLGVGTSLEQKEGILKSTILGTEGVISLSSFSFSVDRVLKVALVVYEANTIHGPITSEVIL